MKPLVKGKGSLLLWHNRKTVGVFSPQSWLYYTVILFRDHIPESLSLIGFSLQQNIEYHTGLFNIMLLAHISKSV